jgi:hypothetical protein
MTKTTKKTPAKPKRNYPAVIKFYKDNAKEWRWKITKGRHITSAATEGYINLQDCKENFYNTFIDMAKVLDQVFNNEHNFSAVLKATFVTEKTLKFTV